MKNKSLLFSALAVLATAFIFYNSLQTAPESAQSSALIVDFIINCFNAINRHLDYNTITVLVRKLAHIIEYFIQGTFISLSYFYGKGRFAGRVINVMFFGLLTACIDEYIQGYVSGRGSMIIDVWIDFAGILLAVLFYLIISAVSGRRKL